MFEDKRKELEKITSLFTSVKGLILYCEENYPDRKTSPQILLELRNALDHLIRAISAELTHAPDGEYVSKNRDLRVR